MSSGADMIGMAGGDGSQAIVAAVASRHDIPYVAYRPAHDHFALDIGVDRDDVAVPSMPSTTVPSVASTWLRSTVGSS